MYLDGIAVPIIDGAAGSEVAALALQLNAVFCRTSGVCLAVGSGIDGGGVLVPLTNGAIGNGGGSVGGVRSLDGVACRIASACLAVGHRSVVVPMTRKKPGVANPVSGTGELSGLACNGPTFCLAVGSTTSNEGADGTDYFCKARYHSRQCQAPPNLQRHRLPQPSTLAWR